MNKYHPDINCAAHTAEWLQNRRDELARLGLGGSINEKKSVHRKAELKAIEAGLKAKGVAVKQVPRAYVLPQSAPGDTARMQAHAVTAAASVGVRGYSDHLQAVEASYQPAKYSIYA